MCFLFLLFPLPLLINISCFCFSRELYRGFTAIVLRNGPSNIIFFGLRGPIKSMLPEAPKDSMKNAVNDFISGGLLGACTSTIFYPLNVVKNNMQKHLAGEFKSPLATLRIVLRERDYRIPSLYKGVPVNFTRSLISWGIINSTYEFLKDHL